MKIELNAASRLQQVISASGASTLKKKVKDLEEKVEKAKLAYSKAARGNPSDDLTHSKRKALEDFKEDLRKAKSDLAKSRK